MSSTGPRNQKRGQQRNQELTQDWEGRALLYDGHGHLLGRVHARLRITADGSWAGTLQHTPQGAFPGLLTASGASAGADADAGAGIGVGPPVVVLQLLPTGQRLAAVVHAPRRSPVWPVQVTGCSPWLRATPAAPVPVPVPSR